MANGFGRSVAAPQVGINRRILALNLGDPAGPFTMINPEITWHSDEHKKFTLWDDCLSLPWLMVRVARYESISVKWIDEAGKPQHWEKLNRALSELLQHEIDHLDGVLSTDRACPVKTKTFAGSGSGSAAEDAKAANGQAPSVLLSTAPGTVEASALYAEAERKGTKGPAAPFSFDETIISRAVYESNPSYWNAQVDYFIQPT